MTPVNSKALSRQMMDSACEHLQDVTTQHYKEILESTLLRHRPPSATEVNWDGTVTRHRMRTRPFTVKVAVNYDAMKNIHRMEVDIGFPVAVSGGERYHLRQEMSHEDMAVYGDSDALRLVVRQLEERVVHTFMSMKEELDEGKPLDDVMNLHGLEDLNPQSEEETKRLVEQAKRARAEREVRELIEEQEKLQDPLVAMF